MLELSKRVCSNFQIREGVQRGSVLIPRFLKLGKRNVILILIIIPFRFPFTPSVSDLAKGLSTDEAVEEIL
jgi:hypothetical protein